MFGCKCFSWNRITDSSPVEPDTFSLPSPMPQWPQGNGFATGRINLGELEVVKITKFEYIWQCSQSQDKGNGVTFYKPVGIPDGFFCLGHYCQPNNQPLHGFVLVAREINFKEPKINRDLISNHLPPLEKPVDYSLVWSPNDGNEETYVGCGYFWLPHSPDGYKPMGYVVTNNPNKPDLEEIRCVRGDLTEKCENNRLLFQTLLKFPKYPFRIWSTRPIHRGVLEKGVPVGTFFCSGYWTPGEELYVVCLKNVCSVFHEMPNVDQIHALIKHYGPTIFFHPEENYLPSSVSWFFKNGALIYKLGENVGQAIDANGSNLPQGGSNDGEYWIDLPDDDQKNKLKNGNLESAELYVHVKPALGGVFTDIVMWFFCPFNGPATLKVGLMNFPLSKIGQHVGDWEHFTLRISNFNGELWSVYFSQHSGGEWVEPFNLEFIENNRIIIYSSGNGHASFSHPGTFIQGSSKLGIGVRNDVARSNFFVNSSVKYEIISAEYLGEGVVIEPCWLNYMREWGPTVVYDSRTELDKVFSILPIIVRYSVENMFDKLPVEIYGEQGPTGPKEKNNWFGDERC